MAGAGRKPWLVWGNPSALGACFDGLIVEELSEDSATHRRVHDADPDWPLPNVIELEDDELELSNGSWILRVEGADEARILEEVKFFEGGIQGYMPYWLVHLPTILLADDVPRTCPDSDASPLCPIPVTRLSAPLGEGRTARRRGNPAWSEDRA